MTDQEAALDSEAWMGRLPAEVIAVADAVHAHPGPWLTAPVAAAACDQPERLVQQHLLVLCAGGILLAEQGPRYRLAAARPLPPSSSDSVVQRVVAWYLYAADAAVRAMGRDIRRIALAAAAPDPLPPAPDGFVAGYVWMQQEQENLIAVTRAAFDHKLDQAAWQLALMIADTCTLDNDIAPWAEAVEVGRAAADRAEDLLGKALLVEVHGMLYSQRGLVGRAAALQHLSAALREEIADPVESARSANAFGLLCLRRGQMDDAVEHFRRAENLAEDHSPRLAAIARGNAATSLCLAGRFAEAETLLRASREEMANLGMPLYAAGIGDDLSRALRGQGRLEEALDAARAGMAEIAALGVTSFLAAPLTEAASTLAELGRSDEALDYLRQAAVIYQSLRDRQRLAATFDQAAELYREAGDHGQAEALVDHAQAMRARLSDDDAASDPNSDFEGSALA